MAGGMDRRARRSPSLAERTAAPTSASPTPADAAGPASHAAPVDVAGVSGPQRHCWVVDGGAGDGRAPGLLVEWRQLGGAWQGRVAYVVGVDGEATLVEAWVPASQLRRASG